MIAMPDRARHARARLAGALTALALAPAALAVQAEFALQDALAHLPGVLLEQPAPQTAYFIDVSAALQTVPADAGPQHLTARMRAGEGLRAVLALEAAGVAGWQQAAGIAPTELHYLAAFGKPAARTTVWGLGSPQSVRQLMQALPGKGFSPYAAGGLSNALANGEPLVLDLTRREPGNPWLGPRGQTSIVAPLDTGVVQAGTPQAAALVQNASVGASLAAHPALSPALAALHAAHTAGARTIQAIVLHPVQAAEGASAVQARLRGAPEQNPPGERVPAYEAGIVADLQADKAPELGIALSYGDCIAATAAGDLLARAWQAQNPAGSDRAAPGAPRADATVTASISTHAADTGCAVLVRLTEAGHDRTTNAAFDAVSEALARGELPLLRIDAPGP